MTNQACLIEVAVRLSEIDKSTLNARFRFVRWISQYLYVSTDE